MQRFNIPIPSTGEIFTHAQRANIEPTPYLRPILRSYVVLIPHASPLHGVFHLSELLQTPALEIFTD